MQAPRRLTAPGRLFYTSYLTFAEDPRSRAVQRQTPAVPASDWLTQYQRRAQSACCDWVCDSV